MYRDVLVHVDGGPTGRGRVQFAADLAERSDARLNGLHVTPPAEVPPLYKPSFVAGVAAKRTADLALDARRAEEIFSEATGNHSIATNWSQSAGDVVRGISDKARFADLVIVGQDEWQGSPERHPLPIAHSVVLKCGRPVMVVPAKMQRKDLARIAIAWDGSREAVRAVHDALPLLRQSRSVQVITMLSRSAIADEMDTNALSAHLARHGIEVGSDVLQVRTAEEHASLRKQIESGPYDLLVMGGYSHPMWLEFIFGGTTQSILLSSGIPVFVSH